MQDPSIFPRSPSLPSAADALAPPDALAPGAAGSRAWIDGATDVTGLLVVSGTGEILGRAVGIEPDRHGMPKWMTFLEDGSDEPRRVKLMFVRGIADGTIRLAGPREGYHITRIMRE